MEGVEKLSILTKPYAGWTNLRIGENSFAFATFSHMEDVPVILGHVLLDALHAVQKLDINHEIPFFVAFDCAGHDVMLSNLFGDVCITDSAEWSDAKWKNGTYASYNVFGPDVNIREAVVYMAYGLANDIQNNLDDWVQWDASLADPDEEAGLYAQQVADRTQMLKRLAASLLANAKITEKKLKSYFTANSFHLI